MLQLAAPLLHALAQSLRVVDPAQLILLKHVLTQNQVSILLLHLAVN